MCLRYEAEFLSPLVLLAVVGILSLERVVAGRPVWRHATRWGWGLLLAFSVAFNFFARSGLYAEAQRQLGNVLSQKGRVDEAIVLFEKALAIQPDNAQAHNSLGVALLKKGMVDAAIPHFRKVLASDSRVPMAHYNLANALLYQGQLDEAVHLYQKALAIRPDYADAHNTSATPCSERGGCARRWRTTKRL
jgi:tetratricopeptide (TPR) repeat protein